MFDSHALTIKWPAHVSCRCKEHSPLHRSVDPKHRIHSKLLCVSLATSQFWHGRRTDLIHRRTTYKCQLHRICPSAMLSISFPHSSTLATGEYLWFDWHPAYSRASWWLPRAHIKIETVRVSSPLHTMFGCRWWCWRCRKRLKYITYQR